MREEMRAFMQTAGRSSGNGAGDAVLPVDDSKKTPAPLSLENAKAATLALVGIASMPMATGHSDAEWAARLAGRLKVDDVDRLCAKAAAPQDGSKSDKIIGVLKKLQKKGLPP